MPELPEVEAVRRSLEKTIRHKYLCLQPGFHPKVWQNKIERQSLPENKPFYVAEILRFGKYLIFYNDNNIILSHLRMTGRFSLQKGNELPPVHTHVRWLLTEAPSNSTAKKDNNCQNGQTAEPNYLSFSDIRRFGRVQLWAQTQIQHPFHDWLNLGIEPLTENWQTKNLYQLSRRHPKLKLKAFLLRQNIISGLGNIYADEICFASKLHPLRPVGTLTRSNCETVIIETNRIIRSAISARGTTFRNYVDANGEKGDFALSLQVYGRKKEKCFCCKTPLETIKIAGRTSVFCPTCQKMTQ